MPQLSPNIGLPLYDRTADKPELFIDYRDDVNGTGATSGFSIIDDKFGEVDTTLELLKGVGWTDESIMENSLAIAALKEKGVYTALVAGTNTLTATITDFTGTPPANSTIMLVPNALNTTTVTLSINSETAKPVNKARGKTGTVIYDVLEAKDLRPNVPILIRKTADGTRYVLVNFGEDYARNIFYDNGDTTFTDMQTKTTLVDNKITNSFNADIDAYFGNVKTIDDFQNSLVWTQVSGTQSFSTTNPLIGDKYFRITTTAAAITNQSKKDNIALDLTKLNNGQASGDDDYILMAVRPSNVNAIDIASTIGIQVSLGADSIFSTSNRKFANITTGLTSNVWSFFKIKKSDFGTVGTVNFNDIKSLRVAWQSLAGFAGEYVDFQLIQLVKKDPLADYPNPFQKFGVRDFAINSGEWFVGKEFGKVVVKEISNVLNVAHLISQKIFNNFTIYSKKEVINSSVSDGYISWYTDANNYVSIYVASDLLSISSRVAGVVTTTSTTFDIASGDMLEYTLNKSGSNLSLLCLKNGASPKEIAITSSLSSGYLAVGSLTTGAKLFSISITEIGHAHHSDVAEIAFGLTEQAFARVKNSANQSLVSNTLTPLVFNTVSKDNRAHFDIANPTRLTIRETGLYNIIGNVRFAVNTTGVRGIYIRKNGTTTLAVVTVDTFATYNPDLCVNAMSNLNVGEYIELLAIQQSGGALNVEAGNDFSPVLSIAKIG